MRSNCLLFALALCARRRNWRGLTWRMSHWGPFPHFLYKQTLPSGRVRKVSFVPIAPRKRLLPPPLFAGRVKWGD